jgi:hypothetical protein
MLSWTTKVTWFLISVSPGSFHFMTSDAIDPDQVVDWRNSIQDQAPPDARHNKWMQVEKGNALRIL